MTIKKILYLILGCIGFILGAIGAVLPLLPAFPFLLLAAICFAKSSEKVHNWFINTKLYKKNLESFVQGRGMSWPVKIRVMITITLIMSVGFIMMALKGIVYGCAILGIVWLFHIVYFSFRVKTAEI